MKKTFILLIGILVFSCNQGKNEKPKTTATESTAKITKTEANFDWLLGKWKRSNEEAGKETFASWDKKSNTDYVGFSYTTQKGDTVYEQNFRLVKLNNDWSFTIALKGETTPSSFKMISYNEREFTCENNDLDYPNREADSPNKIKYWINNDNLYATISGEKIELQFEYVSINE
ncbi:hypothetical protein [Flavivirga eckloniae]|nr:hypothetical protein [Flavivirga eckloniae]